MKLACKIFIAALAYTVIAMVVHTLSAIVEMPYYLMTDYFPVWSKLMMSSAGPPGTEFYVISILSTVIAGLIFAGVYSRIKTVIHGKGTGKGIRFGIGLFLLTGVPAAFSLVLLINLPVGLIVIWTFDSLVISLLGGIVIERLLR